MKPRFTLLAVSLFSALSVASVSAALKPRIVVLTDISPTNVEPDDMESIIRLFACADLFEIEGLVATTGWSSDGNNAEWIRLIHDAINAYEKDLPNLQRRSGQQAHLPDETRQHVGYWPSPDYLRSVTVVGSQKRGMEFIGRENTSPGSDLIIELADDRDERPIWVQAWGGGNTLAQAIWRVKEERTPEQLKAFLKRIRFYTITDQDRGYEEGTPFDISSHQWMRREFEKELFFLWDESAWRYQNGTGKQNWDEYAAHIQGHGHLGSMYPKYKYGVEGDTPSFLYVWPNGLNEPEHPGFCGWGGYFEWGTGPDEVTRAYVNQAGTPAHAISKRYEARFYPAIFNDFVARMDWVKDGVGNRNPVVSVNGDSELSAIRLTPAPGDTVTLDASGSKDPDGNKLKFSWWVLSEAGTYTDAVAISGSETSRATITMPSDAAGRSLHVICEVADDGTPNLTSYRRIIIEPTGKDGAKAPPIEPSTMIESRLVASLVPAPAGGVANVPERPRVIITSDFPPIGVVKGGNVPNDMKSDPDDMQSMVRFLLYANEFDLEGLMATAGTFAMEARKQNILDVLDRYEMVHPNLKRHDPDYPTADHLRSVTYEGRGSNHGLKIIWGKDKQSHTTIIGEGMDSEASRAILAATDKPDPRPLWIGVWGGPREVAQAIWDVKHTRSEAELRAFISKLRVFLIAYQDATHGWLMEEFPDLFIIDSRKTYQGMFGGRDPLSDLAWVNEHIRHNHGPLGDIYPHEGMGCTGVCEGDSPSFLYLVSANRGINNPEDPTQPSWGGQSQRMPGTDHYVDGPGPSSISRWRKDYQQECEVRANWMLPRKPA